MPASYPLARPLPLPELAPEVRQAHPELTALARLAAAGLPVGSIVVVPSAVEERFYRLNNLPQRLNRLFASVDPADPDEDDVEEAVPAAEAMVRQSYMLDEFIDEFYRATTTLPERLRVRRPQQSGVLSSRGRPALMALKHSYQQDWSYAAVWTRLLEGSGIALEARPVLIHDGSDGAASDELVRRAEEALGRRVRLRVSGQDEIVGVDGV